MCFKLNARSIERNNSNLFARNCGDNYRDRYHFTILTQKKMAQLLHKNGNNFSTFVKEEINFTDEGKLK